MAEIINNGGNWLGKAGTASLPLILLTMVLNQLGIKMPEAPSMSTLSPPEILEELKGLDKERAEREIEAEKARVVRDGAILEALQQLGKKLDRIVPPVPDKDEMLREIWEKTSLPPPP